jgi:transposase
MSSEGVGTLVFIDGTMDRFLYKRILVENIPLSKAKLGLDDHFIFQKDNDPKHTLKYVRDFFDENNIELLDWPSQSPDLNPIKHLWDHVKREVRKRKPRTIKDLKQMVEEIWNVIPPEVCKKLVYSMPKRIEAVVRARGRHTKY